MQAQGLNFVTALTATVAAAVTSIAIAQTPSVTLLGFRPGSTYSQANGVSADGSTVVGTSGSRAFIWRANTGLYDIGAEPGASNLNTYGYAISADGSTVVGSTGPDFFRWRGQGTFESLGRIGPGYSRSDATAVSGNGDVIVGWGSTPSPGSLTRSFRWNSEEGTQTFGFDLSGNSTARGVSTDGSTIVGYVRVDTTYRAYSWSQAGGLTLLPSAGDASALAVNFDGRIIVGGGGANAVTATMWRNSQVVDLGTSPGWQGSAALCVNDDGTVVGGQLAMPDDITSLPQGAIWTPDHGFETLTTYLNRFGVAFPEGWTASIVNGVSADGRTIVGNARNGLSPEQAFVAVVPAPAVLTLPALAAFYASRRRRYSNLTPPSPPSPDP
ncbi:hypothetical protein [Limnofasciculus baicalensis]|uniref:PEP-CTERM sorting domain-containing protein n=1 Tax=Limnofasciculus baicalensis BBK-W-15 TaxID=2699891 RepID=A0AAE3H1R4_9CYAN|nr:hypothetical protein [Limnofasciculus baicalensis]MCP2732622.1 hypothetical protein [Limnofasciculus baicalensis BBK-W-15]